MSKWLDIRDLLRFEASADGTSASLIAVEKTRRADRAEFHGHVSQPSYADIAKDDRCRGAAARQPSGPARRLPARYVEGGACRRPNTHPHAQDARWVRNLLHGQRGEIRPNPRDLRGWRGDRALPVRNV